MGEGFDPRAPVRVSDLPRGGFAWFVGPSREELVELVDHLLKLAQVVEDLSARVDRLERLLDFVKRRLPPE